MAIRREDFIQEILADPENDEIRLVCADWYEEHGQAERAEFIRAQVELARPDTEDDRRRRLQQRARDLLAAHAEEWARPLLEAAVGQWTVFDLRPLRAPIHAGLLKVDEPIGSMVFAYDALVTIAGTTAMHFPLVH